ncbi:MAG TPA: hypothetical protein VMV49_16780 [Candidatus Deferrimicrobium sp.]|nr:hypothetical protein [Candidatus Deferrimicrobium sp.]
MREKKTIVMICLLFVFFSATSWNFINSKNNSNVMALQSQDQIISNTAKDPGTVTITANPPLDSDWTDVLNPYFPNAPNEGYGIDTLGCWASHKFDEMMDPTQGIAGVEWKKNCTTPVNMKNYKITSASLSCTVFANVSVDVDTLYDDVLPFLFGDYVRFYVLISDRAGNKQYEVAYNQTTQLGMGVQLLADETGPYSVMSDTLLITVSESLLISYLTSVLETDYVHYTITLGIFIYCEDNDALGYYEIDTFIELRIKSFDLTFNYEKIGVMPNWLTWLLIGLIVGVVCFYTVYMVYFRIPKVIRLIRKTAKNIKAGKETPPLDLSKRNTLVTDIQTSEINLTERELQQYEPLLTKIKEKLPKFKKTKG